MSSAPSSSKNSVNRSGASSRMGNNKEYDPEKASLEPEAGGVGVVDPGTFNGVHGAVKPGDSFWSKMQYYNSKLEAKLGIESRGIERVSELDRTDTRLYGNTFIWAAATCVLPTFGLGVLGPCIFELGLGDSLLTIFFFNVFSAIFPSFCSIFGPKLGLRQMTSARFSWGWYGAKIVALLNCIACVGWSIVNTIAGAQTLEAVADYKISAAAGTVIIALCTLILGLFGYRAVHRFERFAWIPTLAAFLALLGVGAKHLYNAPMGAGQGEAASVLSFGGAIFGFTVGWSSLSSDYNVYMPADAKSWKVFGWTYFGICFPTILIMWLGAAVGCGTVNNPEWLEAYENHELGGLVAQVFAPIGGGGKFFMVILVLSVVANNIINVYSMGMSISVISAYLAAVPRLVWPVIITAIYIPLAIIGAGNFAGALEHFLNVLGYWLAIYLTVVIEEHFIFRKGSFANYDAAAAWNHPEMLPWGIAGVAAACFGVMGAVLGMAQVWFIGPIGALVGGTVDPFGGDIGFELSMSFTAVTFPLFRYLEKKYLRR